jgi:hypothetical protein
MCIDCYNEMFEMDGNDMKVDKKWSSYVPIVITLETAEETYMLRN